MGTLLRLYLCFLPIVSLSFCLERFECNSGTYGEACSKTCGSGCKNSDCNATSGHCECLPEWKSPLCHLENVAVNKPCSMSSSYVSGDSCEFAVNGKTTGEYSETGERDCIHTSLSDKNSWWEVDLGRPYPVYSISVYPRRNNYERMQNVVITVDEQHCYTFTTVHDDTSGKIDINCTSGVLNGRVILVSRPSDSGNSSLLNICEFQVWSCPLHLWGSQCDRQCGNCIDGAVCDKVTGHCPCKPGFQPPLCIQENVAVNKPCNISSFYFAGDSCTFAVNGKTTGEYSETGERDCIHTGPSDTNSWWEVDLGRPYPVYSISLYPRRNHYGRMQNVVITVDEQHCYTFTTVQVDSSGKIDINCTSGVVNGRVIRISRPSNSVESGLLNICEFQVWSCPLHLWGSQCDRQCNCIDGAVCDKVTGHCPCKPGFQPPLCIQECDPGTYGEACTQKCGSGCNISPCNSTSGYCDCLPGWKPPLCNLTCDSGTYGEACNQKCGSGCKNSECNSTSGYCECLPGWKPPLCHLECDSGTYGEACTQKCGSGCKNSACNSTSGYCECLHGWKPPLCLLECDSGTYGEGCTQKCGSGCKNSACNSTSGYCECLPGWKPPLCHLKCDSGTYGEACTQKCGSGCKNSECNSTSGYCECFPGWKPLLCHLNCDSGTYGDDCSKTCGSGCKNSICNSSSGYCECLTGWKPPLCQLDCDSGTYGDDCSKTCGSGCKNSICNSISGYCECLPGWKPPLCHLENVAVNKTCNISSTLYVTGDSCTFAVNGQSTGEYSETGRRDCIHTGLTDKNTWWEVDLGRPYPVYSISVYPRRAYYGRMQNVVITVDGQHCYKFTTVQVDTSGKIDINCTSGVVNGKVIRVSRPSNSVDSSLLNICEFQVWSCPLHFWGSQCDRQCGTCSDGAVCDKVTGHCPCKPGFQPPQCIQDCDSGTYGDACSKTCGSGCKNSECNATSGHCECLPGWKPSFCDLDCDPGTFGEACKKTCGSGCKTSDCNRTSGHCECLPGWMPPLCYEGCPLHFWGSQCDRSCGHCINGTECDKVTGHCICKPGFLPPLCTQENVALRKTCKVKSMSSSDNSCDKGVDGDTLSSGLGCFESARMNGPWWEVDLGRPYPVYNITVWPREYNEHRLTDCVITVDGKHCYTFKSIPDSSSSGINISCTSGVINGRVVHVSTSQNTVYEKVSVINFCEIQVWVCAAQFWGSQCENTCKNCTEGAFCDKVTGDCP